MSSPENRKKTTLVKALLITGVFFTLLVGFEIFYYYGSKISGQIIRQIVAEKTNGNYTLSFDDIKLSYAKKDIELTGLAIRQSNTIGDNLTAKYSIEVPKLFLSLKSVFEIYIKRELTLNYVEIVDPQIYISRDGNLDQQKSLSFETGNLYELVNEYIKSFAIDSLKLNNGGIAYTREDSAANDLRLVFDNIRFEVSKFLLDQDHDKTDKFLLTENIILSLTDQKINLPDSMHFVSFDKFSLSTKDQGISFKNLKLSKRLKKDTSSNIEYNIQLDYLRFLGIEFKTAYLENKMILEAAEITNPKIEIINNQKFESGNVKIDFGELILNVFGELQVGKVHIKNGSGSFKSNVHGNEHFRTGQVDLLLENFQLDSTNYQLTDIKEFYGGVDINIKNQRILTPDSSHVLEIRNLNYSNKNAQLNISGAQISPVRSNIDNAVDAYFPTVQLSNFVLEDYLSVQELVFEEIIFFNPSISTTLLLKNGGNSSQKSFWVKSLKIYNGDLDFNTPSIQSSLKSCDLNIENLKSDFFEEHFLLDSIQFNRFRVGSIDISNEEMSIIGSSLRCSKDLENLECYNLSISNTSSSTLLTNQYVQLKGINFRDILKYKRIRLPYLFLKTPSLEVNIDSASRQSTEMNNWIKNSRIKQIDISNGNISISKQSEQSIYVTELNSKISNLTYHQLDSAIHYIIEADAGKMDTYLPQIEHDLSIQGLVINESDSTLSIKDIAINPNLNSKNTLETVISAQNLELKGLNFGQLKNNHKIDFRTGHFDLTEFLVNIEDSIQVQQQKNENSLRFDSLIIYNNHFKLANRSNTIEGYDSRIIIEGYDEQKHHLKAKNYRGQIGDFRLLNTHFKEGVNLKINEFNTSEGLFSLSEIRAKQHDEWNIQIPQIEINELDLIKLSETGEIHVGSINVNQPSLKIGEILGRKPREMNQLVKIRSMNINQAEVQLKLPEQSMQDSMAFHRLNIQTANLSLSKDWKESILGMDFFKISGSDFKYTLPDSLYNIIVTDYAFDIKDGNMLFRKLALEPIYNRGQFQNHIAYQKDWFNGFIESIEITGVAFDALLKKEVFEAEKVNVYQLNLDTHRDKRIPREPNLYKPLPQTMIRDLSVPISLDTISFLDSYISHSEFSETGEQPGLIFFQDVDGSIFNFTNIDSLININRTMLFKSSGKLMYTGDFVIQVKFDLRDTKDSYHFQGHVGGMELTEMNRFLENTAFVHVRDGVCESVSFSFDANEDYAIGEMEFYYDDLKISVINQETYDMKGLGNSLKSFFANTFVVSTKNPHFLFLRDGDIFFERDTSKSIFNYWGKSLLSGVVSSIGATNNKKEIKQKNEELRQLLESKNKQP